MIRTRRAVLPDGIRPASVAIADGRIVAVGEVDETHGCTNLVDLQPDEVLLPGLIDVHVHVNEPGRTEWEGYLSATKAAAAGGITTLIDMPLNSQPSTTSVAALNLKRGTARDQISVNVGYWGGAVPGNSVELQPLWDAGVFGFKCFLGDSGLEEYPYLSPDQLRETMAAIAGFGGLLIVHAEDAGVLTRAPTADGRHYDAFMASHPAEAELVAVRTVVAAMRETGCRVHILHLAAAEALPIVRGAKDEGLPLTVETCPHYLTFDAEEIPDGATEYKCCPPLRGHANRMVLWQGLADGTIDLIASDHSPCTVDLKRLDTGDFGLAWGGIASVQLGPAAVWTQARELGHSLSDLARWMGSAPADLVGLPDRGRIAAGAAADLTVFAPEQTFVVDKNALFHKNPVTPYDGRTLAGAVRATWLAGRPLDLNSAPRGAELLRR
nr:allantoinase AllB [Propionicimonas sp.]